MPHVNEEVVNRVEGLLAVEDGEAPNEPERKEPAEPVEASSEPTKEVDADEAPVQQQSEEKEQVAEEKPAEEVNASSLHDLAEYLNQQGVTVDEAELYNLTLPITNAQGEREEITIGQWKDEYQSSIKARADAERSAQQAQDAAKALQSEQQKVMTRLNELAALAGADEAQIAEEAKAVNWSELQQDDPTEYVLRRQQFEDRMRSVQGRKQQILQQVGQQQQQDQQEQQGKHAEYMQAQYDLLPKAIPEWKDAKIAETERGEIAGYLGSIGYAPNEIDGIVDHRAVVLMRKAMLFDKQRKANPEAKRVLKIGTRVVKPGAVRSKQQVENSDYQESLKQFRKSGGRDDDLAAALVEKHLLGEL